jgi:hypothetical protein
MADDRDYVKEALAILDGIKNHTSLTAPSPLIHNANSLSHTQDTSKIITSLLEN